MSFTQTIDTYNKRKRENLFSEGFIHQYGVDIPEEFASNYIHGYRKDSKEAMDIEKEKKASRKGSNFYKYIKSR